MVGPTALLPGVDPVLEHPDRRCRGKGLDLFFPRHGERTPVLIARIRPVAEFYCAACPIRAACERAGQANGYGMWGGVLFLMPDGLVRSGRKVINLLTVKGG